MRSGRLPTILAATLASVFPAPAAAGSLEVNMAATAGGTYGLQVNVVETGCSTDDLVVDAPPTISGDFVACNTITAVGVQVVPPGATFTTRQSVALANEFSVAAAAPFTVHLVELLGTPFAYVEDRTPGSEMSYRARFTINIDNLSLAGDDRLELLNGYSADGAIQFQVILKRNMTLAENRLILAARRNDGSFAETPFGQEQLLPAGYHEIEMFWYAGSGSGFLAAAVDDVAGPGLSGLGNSNGRIDFVRLGAVGGTLDPSSGGFFYLDNFASQRLFDLTADPCIIPDDGTGTGEFPPLGCAYLSPTGAYTIIDGLPPGTEIVLEPIHHDLDCAFPGCGIAGGSLGFEKEVISLEPIMKAVGSGTLAGFERILIMAMGAETHSAPRNPGDPVQTFDTAMWAMAGSRSGDPDFDVLIINAGEGAALPDPLDPSPGQTTMTQQPSGEFQVDSFFDIFYEISFVGAPGGDLDGLSGTTRGSLKIAAFADPLPIFADGFESGDLAAWSSAQP